MEDTVPPFPSSLLFFTVTTQTLLFLGQTARKYSIALSTPFFPARSALISIRSANYSSAVIITPPPAPHLLSFSFSLDVAGNISRDYPDYYYYLKNVSLLLSWQPHADHHFTSLLPCFLLAYQLAHQPNVIHFFFFHETRQMCL